MRLKVAHNGTFYGARKMTAMMTAEELTALLAGINGVGEIRTDENNQFGVIVSAKNSELNCRVWVSSMLYGNGNITLEFDAKPLEGSDVEVVKIFASQTAKKILA